MPDNSLNITIQRRSYADALHARLPRITEIIRSQRIITKALIDGKQAQRSLRHMALADKAAHFAERLKSAPAKVEAAFDLLLAKIDAMESDGVEAITAATAVVDDAAAGIKAVKDIVSQLSNGTA